jgi:hypothetical protein
MWFGLWTTFISKAFKHYIFFLIDLIVHRALYIDLYK